jgi:hypothetical protein
MSSLRRLALVTAIGVVLAGVALYSALPARVTAVQVIKTTDTETVLKILGDGGGGVTRTFALPPAPRGTPSLGIALRPATYLERPSGTITVRVGTSDRCTFGPDRYTDGGAITCPVRHPGADSLKISVRGATGPVALIERQSASGENLAGIWVQLPPSSREGRVRSVLTALSTTRPWLFSWPLAIFGFALSVCGSIWLGLWALSSSERLDIDVPASSEADAATSP